ncbi:phage GP46 family protein [Acetobacter tropicalis]|uniref:phage GP46 family protein n=1 Tax=Acetobacter tropicalis TaxID=104102 RepID=UPI000586CA52|nr:phage GP46 family protein [Acetobacter tropicalis]
MDLQIVYDNTQQMFDLELNDQNNMFNQTKDIETLIQVQLFTDKGEWWGDTNDNIGSSLYLLKDLDQTRYAQYGKSYCENALEFLTDYQLCKNYECECEFDNTKGILNIQITVEYNSGIKKEYAYVWEGV